MPRLSETASAMQFARPWLSDRWWLMSEVGTLRPVPESMRPPRPMNEAARLKPSAENIASALHRLDDTQRAGVVAAMQKIIPGLIDIRAVPVGRYLTLSFIQAHGIEQNAELSATEMSDGALRALAIVVAAEQLASGELLIVEEPEVNLHPGAADVVYDVLHRASSRGTVLVTTHSPELLDRAKDDEILVCEYVDGVTKVGALSASQRALVQEGLFSVGELMRSEDLRREGAAPRVVRD
jgi:type I restriction enzyme M protein